MNIYWGYDNSGKLHMRYYAMYNGKTIMSSRHRCIDKQKYTVRNRGLTPNNLHWMDYDLHRIFYFKQGLRLSSCEYKYSTFTKLSFVADDAYINPDAVQKNMRMRNRGSNILSYAFTEDDLKKYMSDEYKGTNIYFFAFLQQSEVKKWEPIGYTTLNINSNKIFDDVDYIETDGEYHFLLQQLDSDFSIPPHVLVKLKKANNVIPYKSNILDCIVKQIDSFSHHTLHKYEETPTEIYKRNKNIIWDYLDHERSEPVRIAKLLRKHDIPYRYFDLDTDSYKECFGWEHEIDKEYTSYAPSWQGYEDRFNEVENIAKEYIALRKFTKPFLL